MGAAWLDVARAGDVEAVLADLRTGEPTTEPSDLRAWLTAQDGGSRIELYSDGGYGMLGDLVAGVLRRTGVVRRAVIYLDHDEFGTEHVVLTRDEAGTVRRVHHVYADLDDEGSPSLTGIPAAAGTGPGRTPGGLIDNPAARSALADLFGMPATAVQEAADRAARAEKDPATDNNPSEEWLEAFGMGWDRRGDGAPVNLRPGPVWRDAVARQVAPRLPGQWLARDYDLVRLPASPVMCVVLPGRHSGNAVIHPMYVPGSYGTLQFCVELRSAVGDQAPDPIEPLIHDLTATALPFFDRYGHPDGLHRLCQERVDARPGGRVNPHDLRCLAATEVILGRYHEAAANYAELARNTAGSTAAWARDIAEEAHVRSRLLQYEPAVVHEALTDTIHEQMTHVGLNSGPRP
ncbi:hypothetical protein Ari01nite_71260 [Paractinoplanes rishiriensis]|uniref:Uncharacterized protein n=2 Tax=Paractinoplanes rishiriensis TaxID=1050105 RepID=A0A919K2H0_9ACTN|nr:hypothetical protein Ari01nite_71260 [Actinoplanes rishiriensis]